MTSPAPTYELEINGVIAEARHRWRDAGTFTTVSFYHAGRWYGQMIDGDHLSPQGVEMATENFIRRKINGGSR